jgi:NADH:ubiquinone oxidoreductase subunit F (NADH-binding)
VRRAEAADARAAQLAEATRGQRLLAALAELAAAPPSATCVVIDGAPARPGDFRVRPLLERDPHLVLEGACLAARAAGAAVVRVHVREGWSAAAAALTAAAAAASAAERVAGITLAVVTGAPLPAAGDFTLDAEAAARLVRLVAVAVAPDVARASDGLARARAFAAAHATRLCAISGDVHRPGVYELRADATVADALAAAGGVVDGMRVARLGATLADGALVHDAQAPVPGILVVAHAGRDGARLLG